MGAIFLSYARTDRVSAETLAGVLEGAGHQVWWDLRIESGSEFAAEIEAALNAADVVLVLWSKHSIKSRWVRDEAAIGGDTGRLVPALIDGSQPPIGFRQFQAFDLTGWKGGKKDPRTAALLAAIGRRAGRKDESVSAKPPAQMTPRFAMATTNRSWAIVAALVLVVAAAAIFIFLNNRDQPRGPPLKPTIALLPFTAPSSDAELRDLAAQIRDSLSHTLSQSGVPVRLIGSPPKDARAAGDFLISGELSRNRDKFVASVRLDDASLQITVYSHRFEAGPDDVRDLPDRIGAQMAGNFAWATPLIMLERRHPSDPGILADLLNQLDFTSDPLRGYQTARRAAAKAPNSVFAQVSLAFNTAFVLEQLPRQERSPAVTAARRAAERAQALAPEFGHGAWCILHSEIQRTECEDRLRAGQRLDVDAPFLNNFLSGLLRSVGRLDEAVELARLSYAHDPYVPTKLGWMLRALEYDGDTAEARELYQQGIRWWPEFRTELFWNRLAGLVDRGDFDAILQLEEEVGREGLPPDYRDSGELVAAIRARSPAAVSRICADAEGSMLRARCLLAFASVDDRDGAFALADKLYPARVGRTPAQTERIWLDDPTGIFPLEFITSAGFAPIRRDPRYLELAQRVGLLAYWRSGRAPDFCRKRPEPICAQLLKPR